MKTFAPQQSKANVRCNPPVQLPRTWEPHTQVADQECKSGTFHSIVERAKQPARAKTDADFGYGDLVKAARARTPAPDVRFRAPSSTSSDFESEQGEGDASVMVLDQDGGPADAGTLPPGGAPSPSPSVPSDAGTQPSVGASSPSPAPTAPSPAPAASPPAPAAPTVTFSTVRAPSTPAAMAHDRIPPRINFTVVVTLSGWQTPMLPVTLSVDGSGGANGAATIDGTATKDISSSTTVQLLGTAQTSPGNAGKLRMSATLGGSEIGSGNSFSVAAIPENMSTALDHEITGASRGIVVNNSWTSDSGNLADLDQARRSELVEVTSSTGCFVGAGAMNSGYRAANTGHITDTHGTPVAVITGPGTREANQTFMFLDQRTGVTDIPMTNSGFKIMRTVTAVGAAPDGGSPPLQIMTTKNGAAVTARGIASAAGAGSAANAAPQPV